MKKFGSTIVHIIIRIVLYAAIIGVAIIGVLKFMDNMSPKIEDVVTIDQTLLESEIKEIGELATLEYDYKSTVAIKDGSFLTKRACYLTYDGIIKAGVDVDEIEIESTTDDEGNLKSVTVTIPDARVLSHEDKNIETVYNEDYLKEVTENTRNNKIKQDKQEHQLQFAMDGYIDEAFNRATDSIEELIHSVYGEEVDVIFNKVPTDADKLYTEEKLLRLVDAYPELEITVEESEDGLYISDDIINFFYDNYQNKDFSEVMNMYVMQYVPSNIVDQVEWLRYKLDNQEDVDVTLVPKWIYNAEGNGWNEMYLYYSIYIDGEDSNCQIFFDYDTDTEEELCTSVNISDLDSWDMECLYYYLMGYYSDTILDDPDNSMDYLYKVLDDGDYEVDGYHFYYYEDQVSYLGIVTDEIWDEMD